MPTYDQLSDENKDILHAWERNARGWANSAGRLLKEARTLQDALNASGGVRDIVTALDGGETVPNTSGIAGAHNLSRAEMAALVGLLDDYVALVDTAAQRQLVAKAAGPTAGL